MHSRLLNCLRCPEDQGSLLLKRPNGGPQDVRNGELCCASCRREIPIEDGIPRFLTDRRNDLCALRKSEMRVRDYDYGPGLRAGLTATDAPEFDAVREALGDCRGLAVLDAGCGAGKFTEAIRNADSFLGVDLSWEGLVHFQKPHGAASGLVQADITRMPLESGIFDVGLSCQVLSHLPTLELRSRFLDEMARVLHPRGRLILTAMHYSFRYRNRNRPREGVEGNSFYHRFEVEELRELLAERFTIHSLHGYWIYLPKTYRLFTALGRWRAYSDRVLRSLPLSLTYGKYLLAVGSPKSAFPASEPAGAANRMAGQKPSA